MPGKMTVTDILRAGQLFIQLAKAGALPAAVGCLADLKAMLKENGVDVDAYEDVRIHFDTDTVKHFVVPAKGPLEGTITAIHEVGAAYPLTQQQIDMYRRVLCPDVPGAPQPDYDEFFTFRIGEYTTSHCA